MFGGMKEIENPNFKSYFSVICRRYGLLRRHHSDTSDLLLTKKNGLHLAGELYS